MQGAGVALVLTVAFTVLVVLIELTLKAPATFRACLTLPGLYYFLIALIGNAVATLLAYWQLDKRVDEALEPYSFLFASIAGVFAFQGVLTNANITFLQKNVLTIDDWISKAQALATAAASKQQGRLDDVKVLQTASQLQDLDEATLNVHIGEYLSKTSVDELERRAKALRADPHYYKALRLASQNPDKSKAIIAVNRGSFWQRRSRARAATSPP